AARDTLTIGTSRKRFAEGLASCRHLFAGRATLRRLARQLARCSFPYDPIPTPQVSLYQLVFASRPCRFLNGFGLRLVCAKRCVLATVKRVLSCFAPQRRPSGRHVPSSSTAHLQHRTLPRRTAPGRHLARH